MNHYKPTKSALDRIPNNMPPLTLAYTVGEKAASVGFEYPDLESRIKDLCDEVEELTEATQENDVKHIESEIGDVLFSAVNICRYYKIDPQKALQGSIDRFMQRFQYIEKEAERLGRNIDDFTSDELSALWRDAKLAPPTRNCYTPNER